MSTWPPPPPPTVKRASWFGIKTIIVVALLGLVGIALVWRAGRSTYHNYQLASSAVDQFHMQLNAGDYNTIYDEATDDFRRSGSREDITRFFTSIHEQMGSAGNKNAAGFHVNWRNGRVWVDQVFNTRFEKGQGQESFVWEIQQERPLLYHYRLDSPNFR